MRSPAAPSTGFSSKRTENPAQWIALHPGELAKAKACTQPIPRYYAQLFAAWNRRRAGNCLQAARLLEQGGSIDAAKSIAINSTIVMTW